MHCIRDAKDAERDSQLECRARMLIQTLGEAKLQRRRRAHRSLRVVRRQRDAMRLRERRHAPGHRKTATMSQVELTDFAGALIKERLERLEVGHPLTSCHGRGA